jgi:hypothetical protein
MMTLLLAYVAAVFIYRIDHKDTILGSLFMGLVYLTYWMVLIVIFPLRVVLSLIMGRWC